MAKEYKRWKIGNIGYIVGRQGLKWQQIGNTIGNNRQQSDAGRAMKNRGTGCTQNFYAVTNRNLP